MILVIEKREGVKEKRKEEMKEEEREREKQRREEERGEHLFRGSGIKQNFSPWTMG